MLIEIENRLLIYIGLSGLFGYYLLKIFKQDNYALKEGDEFEFKDLIALSILPKVIWISFTILILGLAIMIFDFDNFGYLKILLVGSSSLIISTTLLTVFLLKGTKQSDIQLAAAIRGIPLSIIIVYLYFS